MPKKGQPMSEEEKQKRSRALLKHYHGANWTEEDQKQFERERNTRLCKGYRNAHREHYTDYQRRVSDAVLELGTLTIMLGRLITENTLSTNLHLMNIYK